MDLDLNIEHLAVGRGRPRKKLDFEVVREINEADLALISQVPVQSAATGLKKLSDRHHSLARLLASGTPEGEAALITGYDPSRVSILKANPAFGELIEVYRKEVDFEFSTTLQHMAGLSRDAILELRDRMEEDPEKFTNQELRALVSDLTDRVSRDEGTGNKPSFPSIVELVAPESGGDSIAAGSDGRGELDE